MGWISVKEMEGGGDRFYNNAVGNNKDSLKL